MLNLRTVTVLIVALLLTLPGRGKAEVQGQDFGSWLEDFRAEALAAGISPQTVEAALTGVEPIPRVIELDRAQPEFTLTLDQYLAKIVSEDRVTRAKERYAENRELLARVGRAYGVEPRFLVALWGIESNFGSLTGGFSVIDAVATLAHDGRRSTYFRGELLQALRILDEGHITPDAMTGSWAGAMGQVQFMPSSFRRFAVDFDGDGRKDIWNDTADALASAANYLASSGWNEGIIWGRPVRLPESFQSSLIGLETRKHLSEWQALGVRRINGRDLPKAPDLLASIVQPDGPGGRAYAVYENYEVILKWNRSHLFGIAVGTLADRIVGR